MAGIPELVARGITVDANRPMIMAVINATPDSFSDAEQYATLEARMERSREVLAQGPMCRTLVVSRRLPVQCE